jgi:Ca2+-binding EF-hand superfamily protein
MTSKESRNDSSRVISFSEESLREWFAQYDEDGSGINHSGFEKLCEQLGIEPHQVPILMTELDGDQDGKVGVATDCNAPCFAHSQRPPLGTTL